MSVLGDKVRQVLGPRVGDVVLYRIAHADWYREAMRTKPHAMEPRQQLPMIVTQVRLRVDAETGLFLSGQVLMDGDGGCFWVAHCVEGPGMGQWERR